MRVDANAEGVSISVGGWQPMADGDGVIQKSLFPWFCVKLDSTSAPWAFHKGLPYKTISSLELLASTIGVMFLSPAASSSSSSSGLVSVTGFTDSMVSTNVITRGLSTSFPLCLVAMELAAQLEEARLELSLDWIPRDTNAEADALADGRREGFADALDRSVAASDLKFLVLPSLLQEAIEFYSGPFQRTEQPKKQPKLQGNRLRDKDLW